jgi:TrkA domain protein
MCAVDVTETLLPGVGIRYEITTRAGERVGLVAHRDGTFDLVVYPASDPDTCTELLTLTQAEADTLAELMGAPRIAERFADLSKEIPGLVAAQVEVPQDSLYAGHTIGDTRARTLTGASVVALVRDATIVASPGPDTEIEAGDVLVVIGTEAGISGVRRIVGA